MSVRPMDPREAIERTAMMCHFSFRNRPWCVEDVGRAVQLVRGETREVLRALRSDDIADVRVEPWMVP